MATSHIGTRVNYVYVLTLISVGALSAFTGANLADWVNAPKTQFEASSAPVGSPPFIVSTVQ
jgi:hypothetical protein